MIFIQFPFREMSGEAAEVEFEDPMPSDSAGRLIRGLLNRDPRQRLRSFRTMQNHAFFHHFDFESLRLKKVFPIVVKVNSRVKMLFRKTHFYFSRLILCSFSKSKRVNYVHSLKKILLIYLIISNPNLISANLLFVN